MIEDDTHDKLIQAFIEYSKANVKFEHKNSVRTHKEVRRMLRQIRILAKERMEEIHTHHNENRITRK